MDWITNNSMRMTEKSLDYVWQRQRVISENIANSETPGYKAKYISFENELKARLTAAPAGVRRRDYIKDAVNNSHFYTHTTKNETMRLDGNNVNVDAENVELARAQLQYEYLIRQINDQFSRLKTVIEGR